ncbi:MAG: M23 family metallopeptidase [Bacteroidales bacterium]|nr:M23 family metallopeptidase [Bacteroidales bacterium]
MTQKIGFLLLFCGTLTRTFAQYNPPLDIPLLLSGNFAELRSNHFHGGLDFKTQGVTGKPIHAVADGYISGVSVSSSGYGKAVYVTHNDSTMSVYGHVMSFTHDIGKAVEEAQYAAETFEVELSFPDTLYPVRQGDVIALSGNEGYSFGPHLHFELRRTDTGEYIDPLPYFKRQIGDTTPPRATAIRVYQPNRTLQIPTHQLDKPIEAWGDVCFAIQANDYMDKTSNRYGVYKVTLYHEDEIIFSSHTDGFLPNENRMINAWDDEGFMRSFILPGNTWRMLTANQERGIVSIREARDHHFRYVLEDQFGNQSTYRFTLRGADTLSTTEREPHNPNSQQLRWDRSNIVFAPSLELFIPRGNLYEDAWVVKETTATPTGEHCHVLSTHPIAIHKSARLFIGVRHRYADPSKLYVAQQFGRHWSSVGGTYENGWMKADIHSISAFTVMTDTIPPSVKPVNRKRWRTEPVRFKIGDSQTGIRHYKAYVDGKFWPFAFNALRKTLTMLHPQRLDRKQHHELTVVVCDNCGNETKQTYRL